MWSRLNVLQALSYELDLPTSHNTYRELVLKPSGHYSPGPYSLTSPCYCTVCWMVDLPEKHPWSRRVVAPRLESPNKRRKIREPAPPPPRVFPKVPDDCWDTFTDSDLGGLMDKIEKERYDFVTKAFRPEIRVVSRLNCIQDPKFPACCLYCKGMFRPRRLCRLPQLHTL